jgi:hypothetical protein
MTAGALTMARRVARLERDRQARDVGRVVLIETGGDLTPAEAAAIVAEARRRTGPNGWIVEVVVPVDGDGAEGAWARP